MKTASEILKYAMEMELRGKEFYSMYKDKVSNPQIKDIFEGLSSVEDDHYNILKRQLESIDKNQEFEDIDLSSDSGNNIFSSNTKEISKVNLEYGVSDLPILRMAYLIENDFVTFYENAMEKISDPRGKEILKALYEWEIVHRDGFYSEYKKLMEDNWFDQEFYPF